MVTHYFHNQITEQWWEGEDSADPLDLGIQHGCGKAAVTSLLSWHSPAAPGQGGVNAWVCILPSSLALQMANPGRGLRLQGGTSETLGWS